MSLPDPVASIDAVTEVFVNFWTADRAVLGNLYALGTTDPELASSLAVKSMFAAPTQSLRELLRRKRLGLLRADRSKNR